MALMEKNFAVVSPGLCFDETAAMPPACELQGMHLITAISVIGLGQCTCSLMINIWAQLFELTAL